MELANDTLIRGSENLIQKEDNDQNMSASGPLVNWEYALKLMDGDKELVQINAEAFSQSAESDLDILENALQKSDAGEVQRLAHSMKSSLSSLGAEGPAQKALEMEMAGKKKDLSQVSLDFKSFKAQVRQIISELETTY